MRHPARLPFLALLLAAAPAAAQDLAVPPAGEEPGRAAVSVTDAVEAVAPRPAKPPIHWDKGDLKALLAAVEASRDEGLRPADYARDRLAAFVADGSTGADVDAVAEGAARALAHDYADGRVGDRARFDWHIDHSPAALATLEDDLDAAVEDHRLAAYLQGLLPQDERYAALREALRASGTGAKDRLRRDAIRASMERWRWMPRTLGADYLMVNVPAYQVALYRDDAAVATHDVVVGARKTPTPMISTTANAIIVNPWWTLPPAVLSEGGRYPAARGFVKKRVGDRLVIRQRPGPQNALGRMKFDMANPYAIYLHDTPAKSAFARPMRALSHGCIRVKDIAGLADQIGDGLAVDTALDGTATETVPLERGVPVYIVYFTAAPADDGRVVTYGDPYQRDGQLLAALDGKPVPASAYLAAAI